MCPFMAAGRERERRLGLRIAELERRLGMDSSDPGTPSSKERIAANRPHPDGRLTWLAAPASRRKGDVADGIPAAFTGLLMTYGYTGYQHLLARISGI